MQKNGHEFGHKWHSILIKTQSTEQQNQKKDYMLNDGGGLYLAVNINGSKLWRFIYTLDGKRKKFSLGSYPDTSLEIARRKSE
jgi:hypothetical protein